MSATSPVAVVPVEVTPSERVLWYSYFVNGIRINIISIFTNIKVIQRTKVEPLAAVSRLHQQSLIELFMVTMTPCQTPVVTY